MSEVTRIPIGGLVIKADSGGGWIVYEPYTYYDKRKERDVEGMKGEKYPGTFDQALRAALGMVLHKSGAQSLSEIRQLILDFHAETKRLMEAA